MRQPDRQKLIKERIRQNLRRHLEASQNLKPFEFDCELWRDLELLNQQYTFGEIDRSVKSKLFGRWIYRFKDFLYHLLQPLFNHQTEYNASNTRLINYLHAQIEQQADIIKELERSVIALNQMLVSQVGSSLTFPTTDDMPPSEKNFSADQPDLKPLN